MAIKHFNIDTKKPTPLAKYSDTKIIITKVEVIQGEVTDLFSPIQVTTVLPTNETYQYYIHPSAFWKNIYSKSKSTNTDMNVEIKYCKYTNLIISPMSGKELVFKLSYKTVQGEPLRIIVSQDLDGYTFSLTSSSKELILSKFKDARPVRSVFVAYDTKQNFETIHGKVEKHIIPALTDLTQEQIDLIGEIKLIDGQTKSEIKSI